LQINDLNITRLEEICQRHGVSTLYVFGSFALGTESNDSDIDLLVEFLDPGPDGAFDRFTGLQLDLESFFPRKIDLTVNNPFRNSIFQQEVDKSKVLLFAA
jgi:predicted nucleotidyltransferase